MEHVLQTVQTYFEIIIQWSILLCEIIGVLMILWTVIRGLIAWIRKNNKARLITAEGIAVSLTFLMGGEALRSIIVREWQELLILGTIVVLRVVMAIVIHFEHRSERQNLEGGPAEPEDAPQKKQPFIRL